MEDVKKKLVKIVIIAACLALAIAITLATRGGGGGFDAKAKLWIKCNNPDCYAEYQQTRKEYMKALSDGGPLSPMAMMGTPLAICQECGEKSAYIAKKCPNKECGIVFIPNPTPQDYYDRCPECGFSKTEEKEEENEE